MSRILAIDPGVRAFGYSAWVDGALQKAGLGRARNQNVPSGVEAWIEVATVFKSICTWYAPDKVVIEFPRAYYGGKQKAPHRDILELAGVVGAFVAIAGQIDSVQQIVRIFPDEWKQQMTDEVTTPRVKERLSSGELAMIEEVAASLMHNVYDSIGIGLWELGRFEKKRVIAR